MGALGLLTFILTFILSLEDSWFARGFLGAWPAENLQFYNPWDRKWAFLNSYSQLCSDDWDIPGYIAFLAAKAAFFRQAECLSCGCLSPCHPLPRYRKGEANFHKGCLGMSWESLYYLEHERVFGLRAKKACPTFTLGRSNLSLTMSGRFAEPRIFACSRTEQSWSFYPLYIPKLSFTNTQIYFTAYKMSVPEQVTLKMDRCSGRLIIPSSTDFQITHRDSRTGA